MKLDLGCGLRPLEGFEGVDLYGDKAKHKVDLFRFPWPFEDESVRELHASHFLEHIPMREIELARGYAQDLLFAFMDECYRIMKPGALFRIAVPSAHSNRAFQDPTHRRFFVEQTFYYFSAEWRRQNALDHYLVWCDFNVETLYLLPETLDLIAILRKIP